MKILVPGNTHNAYLDNLIPDTPYSVQVQPVYVDGDGPQVDGKGKTREELLGARRGDGRKTLRPQPFFMLKPWFVFSLPSSTRRSPEHARV